MAVKLLTLNIENSRHLERVHATLAEHLPDVVCLQEVLESDCAYLASSGGYTVKYATSGRVVKMDGTLDHWGIAVLSRVPVLHHSIECYVEDPRIRTLREPNDPRRALLVTELQHDGHPYRIITTHFTWTPNGDISDEQKADFARMKPLLSRYSDYVLCGDFNAPRGGEMFGRYVDELQLVDHLPANVRSTLDPKFHRAPALELAVDTIFATREYRVLDVRVLTDISDHKGILAWVERSL